MLKVCIVTMKSFLNKPETLVVDSIDGLLAGSQHLARLDGFPDIKVVYHAAYEKDSVAVISGGGSGHEPAMAGYVGSGLLTAAVCGEVFASPTEDAVLAAIRAVTGPAGCLLIAMNYTGDRLNFGMAAERAKAEGLKVEMVITADDCALSNKSSVGRRGIAGTVLVHKVAGALAASGADLTSVKAGAERAAACIGTMGCSMTVCNMPGQKSSDRLGPEEMEMGLGIHGEPGAYKSSLKPAGKIVEEIVRQITSQETSYLQVREGDRVGLMVNNLGATTPLELHLAAKEGVRFVRQELKAQLERVWVGTFMTSLDMHGLSLTLIKLDDHLLECLDAPAQAPAWPSLPARTSFPPPSPTPVPHGSTDAVPMADSPTQVSPQGEMVRGCIRAACEAVKREEDNLNAMDAKVGDGDCGTTIAKGASAVMEAVGRLPADDLSGTALAVGHLLGRSMGGTSGAVYKLLLTAAAAELKESQGGGHAFARAIQAGVSAASKYGGAQAGSRTMLDALLPAADAMRIASGSGKTGVEVARAAAGGAAEGAEATKTMSAAAGRSSYVPEDILRNVPDPGAVAVSKWMKGIAEALET